MAINNSQKGVSLIITFFIMIIILVVVLSASVLLYSEIKVIRNMGNSMISLYVADSGIEKILYYDRQVLPVIGQDGEGKNVLASRGLCSMLDEDNPNYCQVEQPNAIDSSIYCNDPEITPLASGGCDADACDNCTISFNTTLGNASYSIEATVDLFYYLNAESGGTFGGAGRKIEITAPLDQP